jgi:hypothetical protein
MHKQVCWLLRISVLKKRGKHQREHLFGHLAVALGHIPWLNRPLASGRYLACLALLGEEVALPRPSNTDIRLLSTGS